jgi:hypothetical protein
MTGRMFMAAAALATVAPLLIAAAQAADPWALKPASSLSVAQRRDMHPPPESLAAIDGLQGLQYVKAKDKVPLVRPSTGIVVDEVAM